MPVLRLPLRRRGGGGWPALALLLASTAARANVGPPSSGGQLVAEPVGVLRDVAITREALIGSHMQLSRDVRGFYAWLDCRLSSDFDQPGFGC